MFQHARLRIGTIQQRDLFEIDAFGFQLLDFINDERCLVHVGRCLIYAQLFAAAFCRPQVLAEALEVVADQRVSRIKDIAVRAVVLFQLDDVLYVKIAQQLLHIADSRAAKSIDGLVIVAHCEQRIVFAGQ